MFYGFIFDDLPEYERGTIEYPKLDYALNQLQANITKVMGYERRSSAVVKGNHPLLGVLDEIANHETEIFRDFVAQVKADLERICNARRISTPWKASQPFLGELLGGDDIEFLVLREVDVNFSKVVNNQYTDWENLEPLQIISSPYDDCYPWVPGECPEGAHSWAVLSLDVVALAIQFRSYVAYCDANDIYASKMDFIRNYVLVNAIPTLMASKNMNRISRSVERLDLTHVRGNGRPAIVDVNLRLQEAQYTMARDLLLAQPEWPTILRRTKLLTGVDASIYLKPMDGPETSQNRWLRAMVQTRIWRYLLAVDKKSGTNSMWVGRLKRLLEELRHDRGVHAIRDYTAIDVVETELRAIADLLR